MYYVIRKSTNIRKGVPFEMSYRVMDECENLKDALHWVDFYGKITHDSCKSIMEAFYTDSSKYKLELIKSGKDEDYTNKVMLETKNETAISLFYISRNRPV